MSRRQSAALYRAHYLHADGRASYVTFASVPHDALRWASDWCRHYVQGELLSITEDRQCSIQLRLTP